jgi:Tol biopolymer transport system component
MYMMKSTAILLSFGIAVILCVHAGAKRVSAGTGTDWTLGFCSDRDGDNEIYFIDADGSNLRQLTFNSSSEAQLACSPDGGKFAFVSDRDGNEEIYVMNVDGTGLTRLTNDPGHDLGPDWSPCGTKILFASDRDGDREIYVVNVDGGGLQQLTINSAIDGFQDWSPDGTRIAFHSDRAGTVDIWVMNADGSNPQNLTGGSGANYMPDWSPDGARIVFESTRHGPLELYTMNADGGNVQRLTYMNSDNHEPDWSPDGAQITFVSLIGGSYEVMVINSDGSGLQNMTNNGAMDWGPSWRLSVSPYFGRVPPGTVPERFPPDSLLATDSQFWHGSVMFAPNLQEMHWASYVKHSPTNHNIELFFVEVSQGQWTSLDHPVFADTNYGENNPFFSSSGDTLYFISHRPGGFIFRTIRIPTGWSQPEPLNIPLPANAHTGWQFSVAKNGNIYFEIWRNNGAEPPDIYLTRLINGIYQLPENLGSEINSPYDEFTPFIDPLERYLVFSSNRPGGQGFHDLYVSFRDNDTWTDPVNMGEPLNSTFEDFSPYVSPDGLYLFFATQRTGDLGYNPYWVSSEVIDSIRVVVPTQLKSYAGRCVKSRGACPKLSNIRSFMFCDQRRGTRSFGSWTIRRSVGMDCRFIISTRVAGLGWLTHIA